MSDKMQVNKRLFFGLDLTTENKSKIFNWLSASVMSNRKPVQEHNLHLTLAFLPNVNQLQEEELISFANRLTVNPFNLSFSEVGYWQNTGILFLKPDDEPPALLSLANNLRRYGEKQKIYENPFSFHPHITLLRGCKTKPQITRSIRPITCHFNEFKLFHSTKLNGTLRYLPIHNFAMA